MRRNEVRGEVFFEEHFLLEHIDLLGFVEIMKLLTELPDRIILIAFLKLLIDIGKHDLHWYILVDILFKSHQLRDEMIQLGLCLSRRHQEEDVIQVAFFRNDAVFS